MVADLAGGQHAAGGQVDRELEGNRLTDGVARFGLDDGFGEADVANGDDGVVLSDVIIGVVA